MRRGGGTRWPLVCMIGGWVVPMGPLGRGGGYRADAGSWKGARANPPGTAFAEETSFMYTVCDNTQIQILLCSKKKCMYVSFGSMCTYV